MSSGPIGDYGVLERTINKTDLDTVEEEVVRTGFSVIPSGYSNSKVAELGICFDVVHKEYIARHGHEKLQAIDEHNTIRLPLSYSQQFLDLATNPKLIDVISRLIAGKFVLGQQNGILNPSNDRYNQSAWHRDLPYQHFISSRPIAINALYCIDDFTENNGATCILPGSHQHEIFPSEEFVKKHEKKVLAARGSFIIIDCMAYHRGDLNLSGRPRRAINHVFTIPHIRQQISIPSILKKTDFDSSVQELFGVGLVTPRSIEDYLKGRE